MLNKKLFLKLLAAFVVLVAGFLIYASTRPNTFVVERSIEIQAPVERVFALVQDLKMWEQWSPYAHIDPNMKTTYSENTAGVGAFQTWDGNHEVGSGKNEIVQIKSNEEIQMKLSMAKPFECVNDVVFSFLPKGGSTLITWTMSGEVSFVPKILHSIFDMDKMVGDQFQQGLRSLKELSEKESITGITIPHIFNASLEKVWALWASADLIKKWWGPEFFTAPSVKIDFKNGGNFLLSMMGPDKKVFWNSGYYIEIVPQKKIAMKMMFADESGKTVPASYYGLPGEWPNEILITVEFSEVEQKTQMIVKETGLPPEMARNASLGWSQQFEKMEDLLK